MKQETIIIQIKRHFSLKIVSLACLALCYPTAFAIGFGDVVLRSNLGQVLRVQVPLSGATEDSLVASCFKSKIETLDGQLIDEPRIDFQRSTQTNQLVYLNFVSNKPMGEPAVKFTVSMTCGQTVLRSYPLLLDFADSPIALQSVQRVESVATPDTQVTAIEPNLAANKAVNGQSASVGVKPTSSGNYAPPKKSRHPKQQSASPSASDNQTEYSIAPKEKRATHKLDQAIHTKQAAATGKDVLRVSSDDIDADVGLRMSQSLTESTAASPDQQSIAANKIAQAQFAALLRGEDPLVTAQNEIKKQELRLTNLQNELERIKQLDSLKEQKDKQFSPLLIGLGTTVVALFLALGGLVGIALLKSRKKQENTWWDPASEQKKNVADIVDYLQTTADEGNLDPNPITTARQQPETDNRGTSDAVTVTKKEESAPKFKRMGLPTLEETNSSTFNFFSNRGQSIHIEEISDITQEAEFWMSVNDPHRAIEILEPQGADENQATPITWLYLLDLYRLVGDEHNYNDLRHRFKLKFNAKIPNFDEEVIPGNLRSFEDFPHLVSSSCALWHHEDIFGFLESLLIDDREGERVGFDLPVYRDILFLLQIATELKRPKYNTMAQEAELAPPRPAASPPESLLILPDSPAVKPGEPEPGEYSNSLNFDLLDFKTEDKEKGS